MERYRDAYSMRDIEQVRLIEGQALNGNIILKGLTSYLFRLTNQDQNNNSHAAEIILNWIE